MHVDATHGHAARDWEAASAEQLEKEVSLIALDVLRIASRSRSNRVQLLRLGILPSLTRLMKVTQPPLPLSASVHLRQGQSRHGNGLALTDMPASAEYPQHDIMYQVQLSAAAAPELKASLD